MKKLALLLLVSGCSLHPYGEYQHISNPRIPNDGLDLVCAGVQHSGNLELHAGVCKDVTGYRGEYVRVGARYTWNTDN